MDKKKCRRKIKMAIYRIITKHGRALLSRYEGTRKEAEKWAENHYMKGSYKVERDKAFEEKWKIRGR